MREPEGGRTPPTIPPLIAWASRNSGVIFFFLLLSVAMIEGVAIYASKRSAAADSRVESVAP